MSDTVVSKIYRVLRDSSTQAWDKISFWNKAADTEAADGKTLETKVGAIDGVTSDVSSTSTKYAASIKSVHDLNSNLTANNNAFRFGYDSVNDQYGYYREVDGADTLVPFKSEPNIITRDYSIGLSARFSGYDEHISSTSKDIGIEGYRPISAGFVSWYAGGGANTANISGSVSLNNNIVTLTLRAISNEVTVGGTHTVRVTYIED